MTRTMCCPKCGHEDVWEKEKVTNYAAIVIDDDRARRAGCHGDGQRVAIAVAVISRIKPPQKALHAARVMIYSRHLVTLC